MMDQCQQVAVQDALTPDRQLLGSSRHAHPDPMVRTRITDRRGKGYTVSHKNNECMTLFYLHATVIFNCNTNSLNYLHKDSSFVYPRQQLKTSRERERCMISHKPWHSDRGLWALSRSKLHESLRKKNINRSHLLFTRYAECCSVRASSSWST